MMVFELIEHLKQLDPHWSVFHYSHYDFPECGSEITDVETYADALGRVYLTDRLSRGRPQKP
ncbi:hypothetical protein OKW41_006309 [Paraburkholderia sp. UCT70]|uniref:hypothetical protein n=1 Tax=Paraburkholderia sp. UCT70 TaxID=2991068 RepID=UPI003D1FDFB4